MVWLAGVRRVGKTCLTQTLPNTEYFDCELPRVRRTMEDPQGLLDGLRGRRVVLDEIHRLPNPSELLKIAADHYPHIRIAMLAYSGNPMGAVEDKLLKESVDLVVANNGVPAVSVLLLPPLQTPGPEPNPP